MTEAATSDLIIILFLFFGGLLLFIGFIFMNVVLIVKFISYILLEAKKEKDKYLK